LAAVIQNEIDTQDCLGLSNLSSDQRVLSVPGNFLEQYVSGYALVCKAMQQVNPSNVLGADNLLPGKAGQDYKVGIEMLQECKQSCDGELCKKRIDSEIARIKARTSQELANIRLERMQQDREKCFDVCMAQVDENYCSFSSRSYLINDNWRLGQPLSQTRSKFTAMGSALADDIDRVDRSHDRCMDRDSTTSSECSRKRKKDCELYVLFDLERACKSACD
jgi:hypothetical protein